MQHLEETFVLIRDVSGLTKVKIGVDPSIGVTRRIVEQVPIAGLFQTKTLSV
jgi:hypothetical protein